MEVKPQYLKNSMTKMSRKQCHNYIREDCKCDYKNGLLYRQIYSKFPTLSQVLSIFWRALVPSQWQGRNWQQCDGKPSLRDRETGE